MSHLHIQGIILIHVYLYTKSLVLKHVTVPGQALLEVDDDVVGFGHGPDLDPRLEVGLLRQLQHVGNVLPGTDEGTGNLQVLENQAHGGEAGQWVVRSAKLDKGTVDVEEVEVLVEREATRDGGDDDVETSSVLVHPFGVLTGSDELVGTELHGVGLLGRGTRDGDDLVAAEGLREEEGEVTETTDTNDTDALSRAGTVRDKRVVDGDTTAHERSSELGRKALRDGDGERSGSTPVLCVTTLSLVARLVLGVVGHDEVVAVALLLGLARPAGLAAVGLRANTDAVTDLEVLYVVSDTGDLTDDLVTNDKRVV